MDLGQVRQANRALPLEDAVDEIDPRGRAHVPLGHVADALGMLQPGGRHQGDVAEGRAAEVGHDRPLALAPQTLGLAGEMLQVGVAHRAELLQVVL